MPTLAGVSQVAFTVTDLDRSTRFSTEVLGLVLALDFGHGRLCLDRASGFSVGLLRHPGATGGAFSELGTGLDHLGLVAADRAELADPTVPDSVLRDQAERIPGPGLVAGP